MPVSAIAALMILTTVLLSACEQQQVAQVEDKGTQYYGRDAGMRLATNYGNSMRVNFGNATYQAASTDPISSAPLAAPSAMPPVIFRNESTALPATVATSWSWPVEGNVVERFGTQGAGIANEGITIAAAEGAPIKSAAGGEVAYVGSNVPDYGNMVIVRHPGGELTSYSHAREILVSKGDKVMQGDVLGYVGQSGRAKAPQLHFALREGTAAVDPMTRLPSHMASR
jgi:murein DD-endopeptidase MepM/ murein hydrolase activator NlpD